MRFGLIALTLIIASLSVSAHAEKIEQHIVLKDQAFTPNELTVPAGQTITLIIKNDDAVAAEFESYELHREKIVPPGKEVTLNLSAMKPGTYKFYNDFHRATTGNLIVK